MASSESKGFAPPFPAPSRGHAEIGDLKPHPKNREIYELRDDDELADRIERIGFKDSQRVLVCTDGTILSGHRRVHAAEKAGVKRVPVEVTDIDPDSEEAELELLTANTHREKSDIEKYREAKAWKRLIYDESADIADIVPANNSVAPRELAADKAGMSETNFAKIARVERGADAGDDVFVDQWEKLVAGEVSVHAAYEAVKESEEPDEEQSESEEPEPPTDPQDERDENVLNGNYDVEGQPDEPDTDHQEPEGESIKDMAVESDVREPDSPESDESDEYHTPDEVAEYAEEQAKPDESETESETESESEPMVSLPESDYDRAMAELESAVEQLDKSVSARPWGKAGTNVKVALNHLKKVSQ